MAPPSLLSLAPLLLVGLLLPNPATAAIVSWGLSTPRQCAPLNLTWSSTLTLGSPVAYNLVLIPTSEQGAFLSNISFTSSSNSYLLPELPLPSNAEFIALLQDAVTGADGGRVSQIVRTTDEVAGGTRCLEGHNSTLDFTFQSTTTQAAPAQCGNFTVSNWNGAIGRVGITGLIPGGESFNIPITDPAARTATWTVRIPQNTGFMIAMSDEGPNGSGGSTDVITVGAGSASCLSGAGLAGQEVFSSLPLGDVPTTRTVTVSGTVTVTAGPGGSGIVGGSTGGGGGSNTGAIVGGVVGGVAALAILGALIWFCVRKREKERDQAHQNELTAAGRPWSPPLPADPEANPIYTPTPAFFSSSAGGLLTAADKRREYLAERRAAANSVVGSSRAGEEGDAQEMQSFLSGGGGRDSGPSAYRHSSALDGDLEEPLPAPTAMRFLRHTDSGADLATVELPPLYQDAGARASSSAPVPIASSSDKAGGASVPSPTSTSQGPPPPASGSSS